MLKHHWNLHVLVHDVGVCSIQYINIGYISRNWCYLTFLLVTLPLRTTNRFYGLRVVPSGKRRDSL